MGKRKAEEKLESLRKLLKKYEDASTNIKKQAARVQKQSTAHLSIDQVQLTKPGPPPPPPPPAIMHVSSVARADGPPKRFKFLRQPLTDDEIKEVNSGGGMMFEKSKKKKSATTK